MNFSSHGFLLYITQRVQLPKLIDNVLKRNKVGTVWLRDKVVKFEANHLASTSLRPFCVQNFDGFERTSPADFHACVSAITGGLQPSPSPDCSKLSSRFPAVTVAVRLAGNWQEITPNAPQTATAGQRGSLVAVGGRRCSMTRAVHRRISPVCQRLESSSTAPSPLSATGLDLETRAR